METKQLSNKQNVAPVTTVPPKILVVDDKPENLRVLASLLSENGYDIRVARDGDVALQAVERQLPDLILLDVDMPVMNGFEVCKALQADPVTKEVPVIFVSALSQIDYKVNGFAMGSVDYVTKPIQVEEILARVRTHLEIAGLRKDLRQRMADLEEQNSRLKMFAHGVAHDLRDPLAAVVGYGDWLSMEMDGNEALASNSGIVAGINEAGKKLKDTVESLLVLGTADASQVEFDSVDVSEAASRSADAIAEQVLKQQGRIDVISGMPRCLGHGPWVELAMSHYLLSCLTYAGTPPHLKVFAVETANGSRVRYYVEHNGEDMNDSELEVLSCEFSKISAEMTSGIGLDLVLAKHLTRQMGGTLGIEDGRAKGSRFYMELPRYFAPLALAGGKE